MVQGKGNLQKVCFLHYFARYYSDWRGWVYVFIFPFPALALAIRLGLCVIACILFAFTFLFAWELIADFLRLEVQPFSIPFLLRRVFTCLFIFVWVIFIVGVCLINFSFQQEFFPVFPGRKSNF